jgi:DNA-binding response OmpR family regulator
MEKMSLTKPRVLLVEDEWLLAIALQDSVIQMGFAVAGPVPTVAQALAILAEQEVGLAVLDVSLGTDEKSFPIARALKANDIPFIFVSGYQETDLPREFTGTPLCSKPYTEETLKRHLDQLLCRP